MHPFLSAGIGGVLIGVSAVLLMFLSGHIAGISGIVGGLLPWKLAEEVPLRLAFIAGLFLAPLVLRQIAGFDEIGAPTVGNRNTHGADLTRRPPRSRQHWPWDIQRRAHQFSDIPDKTWAGAG
jgi:hypothetical protein